MSTDHASPRPMHVDPTQATLVGGRYRLDGILGSGGMGVVHRAWDLRLGRRVAIKVLAPVAAADAEIAARLRAEGCHLAATEHPNLVTLFDVSDEPGAAYLVMELVEGESLAERLRREGPLSAREVAAIVTGVAAGLSALHGAGIIHRDVSPANILLGVDGRPRLADFGLARGVTQGRQLDTPEGHIQGTLRYLAPELLEGAPASPASDVYALAAITYAALLGRPPAIATSVSALRAAHREPPIRPSLLRPGLDPTVDDILLAALGPAAGRPTAYGLAVAVATGLRAGDDRPTLAAEPTVQAVPGVAYRAGRRVPPGPARRVALALAGAAVLLGLGAISLAAVDGALSGTAPLVADREPTGPMVRAEPVIEPAPSAAPATLPAGPPAAVQAPVATLRPVMTPRTVMTPRPAMTPRPVIRVAVVDRRAAPAARVADARRVGGRKAAIGEVDRKDREDRSGRRGGDGDDDDEDEDEDD